MEKEIKDIQENIIQEMNEKHSIDIAALSYDLENFVKDLGNAERTLKIIADRYRLQEAVDYFKNDTSKQN